jgi:hypothetical protein
VATSRLFAKCMNAAIKGPSSAGKSEIRKQVLEYFPPEAVMSFSTVSEKALLYYEQDFAHKILSMGEAAGIEEASLQDYLLRELISEGRLRYPVVQKIEGGVARVTDDVSTRLFGLHSRRQTIETFKPNGSHSLGDRAWLLTDCDRDSNGSYRTAFTRSLNQPSLRLFFGKVSSSLPPAIRLAISDGLAR